MSVALAEQVLRLGRASGRRAHRGAGPLGFVRLAGGAAVAHGASSGPGGRRIRCPTLGWSPIFVRSHVTAGAATVSSHAAWVAQWPRRPRRPGARRTEGALRLALRGRGRAADDGARSLGPVAPGPPQRPVGGLGAAAAAAALLRRLRLRRRLLGDGSGAQLRGVGRHPLVVVARRRMQCGICYFLGCVLAQELCCGKALRQCLCTGAGAGRMPCQRTYGFHADYLC